MGGFGGVWVALKIPGFFDAPSGGSGVWPEVGLRSYSKTPADLMTDDQGPEGFEDLQWAEIWDLFQRRGWREWWARAD